MIWDKSGTNVLYWKISKSIKALKIMVMLERLERSTCCLEGLFQSNFNFHLTTYFHLLSYSFHRDRYASTALVMSSNIQSFDGVSGTYLGQSNAVGFMARNRKMVSLILSSFSSKFKSTFQHVGGHLEHHF